MGLLDDLSKLQYGAPLSDALRSIGLQIRERNVAEAVAPIVEDFTKKLQQSAVSPEGKLSLGPEEISLLAQKSIADLYNKVGPGGVNTDAFKSAQGAIAGLSDVILSGIESENKRQRERAVARYTTAQAAEQEKSTSLLDTAIQPTGFTPKELVGKTYRQALATSEVDKVYMPYEVSKLSVGLRNKEEKERFMADMTTLVVKHLGPDYATYIPKNVEKMLVTNLGDLKSIMQDIIKNKYGKSVRFGSNGLPIDDDAYKESLNIIDGLHKAYSEYASSKTGMLQYEASANASIARSNADIMKYNLDLAEKALDAALQETNMDLEPSDRIELMRSYANQLRSVATGQPAIDPIMQSIINEIIAERQKKGVVKEVPPVNENTAQSTLEPAKSHQLDDLYKSIGAGSEDNLYKWLAKEIYTDFKRALTKESKK